MTEQSKNTRAELKSYFVHNSIPTEDDFTSLIDSGLNRADDGLDVAGGVFSIAGGLSATITADNTATIRGIDVAFGTRTNASTDANHPAGRPLYVSGVSNDAGVEFRNAEGSAGVFIGVDTIGPIGTTTNQTLILKGKGTGSVSITSKLDAGASVEVTGSVIARTANSSAGIQIATDTIQPYTTSTNQSLVLAAKGTGNVYASSAFVAASGMSVTTGGLSVTAGGATISSGGLSVTGTLKATGGAVTIGSSAAGGAQSLNVNGTVTATDLVIAQNGVTVSAGGLSVTGTLNANSGMNVVGGNVAIGTTAVNQTLNVNGPVSASGLLSAQLGATITGGAVTVGLQGSNQSLTVNGPVTATGLLSAQLGATITGGAVNIMGGAVTVGETSSNQSLKVNGPVTATGLLSAQVGATITGGAVTVGETSSKQSLTVNGTMTTTGLASATGGLAISTSTSGYALNVTGTTYASGLVTANAGLTAAGAIKINSTNVLEFGADQTKGLDNGKIGYCTWTSDALDIVGAGTTQENRKIKLWGTVTATGAITASNGLTVSAGGLNVTGGAVAIGTSTANQSLTVNGLLTGNLGATIAGGAVTIGTSTANQSLTVNGTVNATGLTTSTGGLVISTTSSTPASGYALHVTGNMYTYGTLTASAGLVTTGLLTTSKGLTITGAIYGVSQFLSVYGPSLTTGLTAATGGLTVSTTGTATTSGYALYVTGTTYATGLITANAGLTVTGGAVTVGTSSSNQALTVNGTLTANTINLAAPSYDGAPVITARTIPSGQGSANESTELILFHSNDNGTNGSGPDYITLRAPAIRLQTYDDTTVSDINNAAGSLTRLNIDSTGAITTYGSMTTYGAVNVGSSSSTQNLAVSGVILPSMGDSSSNGIYWNTNLWGGSGDEAYIRCYRVGTTGEKTKLVIANENDAEDSIAFYQGDKDRVTIANSYVTIDANTYLKYTLVNTTSDERLKCDIRPIEGALDKLLNVHGVRFRWSDPSYPKGEDMGVLAQDVQRVFPEIVHQDPDGTLGVDYGRLVAPLIEAIREQNAQIAELRAQVQALSNARTHE